jgi:hypothetical protein
MPRYQKVVIQKEIQKMNTDVIQKSGSEWESPIVLVPKRDVSMLFYVDYRELNKISKFDAYLMPRIEDVIDQLGPAGYISTLDLTRGYWQVPVSEESEEETAFITPSGLYEFKRMPFGLHGAPHIPKIHQHGAEVLQRVRTSLSG